jgi:hypothetical protein
MIIPMKDNQKQNQLYSCRVMYLFHLIPFESSNGKTSDARQCLSIVAVSRRRLNIESSIGNRWITLKMPHPDAQEKTIIVRMTKGNYLWCFLGFSLSRILLYFYLTVCSMEVPRRETSTMLDLVNWYVGVRFHWEWYTYSGSIPMSKEQSKLGYDLALQNDGWWI